MPGSEQAAMTQTRALGISIVASSLKAPARSRRVNRKADETLSIVKTGIANETKNIAAPLYEGMVHPPLEYCVQFKVSTT